MPYVAAAEDGIEPVSDSIWEIVANIANYNVVSGCAVTYSASDMVATIASGTITHNGSSVTVAGNTVTLVADASNPRWTWIYVASTGTAAITSGDPLAVPTVPELGDNVALALIKVPAAQTIASTITYKLDKRIIGVSTPAFYDSLRTAFRANRRTFAYFASTQDGNQTNTTQGLGAGTTAEAGPAISGEPVTTFGVAVSSNIGVFSGATNQLVSPNHSPRMSVRVQHPAVSANVTYYIAGFFIGASATPTAMAGLRIVTTGNVFNVTRVAAAETTTDLGVLSRTAVLGYEIETVDAGVTWVTRNQAGTALATHTANVPVVSTGMQCGVRATIATATVPFSVAYIECEGTFS